MLAIHQSPAFAPWLPSYEKIPWLDCKLCRLMLEEEVRHADTELKAGPDVGESKAFTVQDYLVGLKLSAFPSLLRISWDDFCCLTSTFCGKMERFENATRRFVGKL